QVRGEDVHRRSDLFSLGLLLYDMATGSQAFAGPSAAVVFDAILNRQPYPVGRLNPSIPAELDRSIDKALEKEKRFRYQHASELRVDLERLRRDLSSPLNAVAEVRTIQPEAPRVPIQQPVADPIFKKKTSKRIFVLGFIPGVGAL